MSEAQQIREPNGKLGVLMPGMGAESGLKVGFTRREVIEVVVTLT